MVDLSMLGGALSGTKSAIDIARSMMGLSEGVAVNMKAAELLSAIADIQGKLLDAQQAMAQLQDELRQTKELLAKRGELERYELYEVYTGIRVYRPRPGTLAVGEPEHYLCPKCKDVDGAKSILQAGQTLLRCPNCNQNYRHKANPAIEMPQGTNLGFP